MKLSKRSRWIILVVGLLIMSVLILTQVKSVQATFTNVHAGMVLLRVEKEIMQKTPAGQYYESLFWKHNDELMQIAREHPENDAEFWRVTRLFIPGLEALLNGEGDSVQITSEQVEGLKTELDWLASVGSPSLREDIEKEQQRLPLEYFVGMTMTEALDFINANWLPSSLIEKTFVPNTDEQWAYYVHNGVYLTYPGSYYVQASESNSDYVYFVPSTGMPEEWNPCVMKVRVWGVPVEEKDTASPYTWYSPEMIAWENIVQNTEFEGIEFISRKADHLTMNLHAFQYNEANQLAVHIWVFANENPSIADPSDYSSIIDTRYEYFQHMLGNLQFMSQ